MMSRRFLVSHCFCWCLAALTLAGCLPGGNRGPKGTDDPARPNPPTAAGPVDRSPEGPKVRAVNLNVPTAPLSQAVQIELDAAKNEIVSFAVQVTDLPAATGRKAFVLKLSQFTGNAGASVEATGYQAFQILPMPIDVKRAGFVRHTGLPGDRTSLPRALLPMSLDQGALNLGTARNPSRATDPTARGEGTGQPLLFWFDVRIPPETPPGQYRGRIEIIQSGEKQPDSSVPIELDIHNFVLPDERHLVMAGNVAWDDLVRLFPDRFEAVRPTRLSRSDPAYARPVETLDQIVRLAQEHRLAVNFARLQPVVKWPPGKPPEVAWKDYDELVSPWLSGASFADRVPLGFWPLPAPDYLNTYDAQSRGEYLAQAAGHFDQLDWMTRSAVQIGDAAGIAAGERASAEASLRYSAEAQQILSLHPRIRVMLPLQEDQLRLADPASPMMLSAENVARLFASAPPLVFFPPLQRLPDGVDRPLLWLRADLSDAGAAGLTPYVGAGGDEYDVRLWSWLSFLRNATLIQFGGVLPRANLPTQAADPNELVWFYPGSWFGVDEPLPTVQLKWLRNAQQDYEYLWLARQRGQTINAFLMARLIAKPVEIQPSQQPDPTHALMCGTANPTAWREAKQLLVDNILLRDPGVPTDQRASVEINLRMLRWAQPQERPVLMGRTTQWALDPLGGPGANWISLRLGIDIYNASDSRPDQNAMQWSGAYDGAEISPKPISIPSLATYHVRRVTMEARVDPTAGSSTPGRQQPLELTFTNGFTREQTTLRLAVPSAVSERRDRPINIDGSLEDWSGEDAIHEGPLVRMFNRPALQAGVLQPAGTPSSVYTSWSDDRLYVAFKVDGVQPPGAAPRARNFVGYQFRRAWGEDLCQLLIQPIYADNTPGPVLHVVCKSNGSAWVERKVDSRTAVDPWQPFEGAEIRYQASFDNTIWRGEVAIPWSAIMDATRQFDPSGRRQRPTLLRFNFAQHKASDGESATWAGPVDFGRDDAFTGIILLRDADNVGMPGN